MWAITPDGLDALRGIYEAAVSRTGNLTSEDLERVMQENADLGQCLHMTNGLDIEAVGIQGSRYDGSRHGIKFENGVVVLSLFGPIYPRANMMTEMSGAVSLQQFTKDFVQAYTDPEVSGIVLDMDSPGGDARGLHDATMVMWSYSKKRKKPVKTFASGFMASAAYYIGAVGQEILGSMGSYVGSIGTVLKAESLPNGKYEIVSSQSPYKRTDPATQEGRDVIQEFVDDVAQVFIEDIAQYRGVTPEKILSDYGQGKVFAGPRAKKQGLLDGISTLAGVVESVAKEAQSGSYKQPKRRASAEVAALLSFSNEEIESMGLKDLVSKFAASTETAIEEQGQPAEQSTEESEQVVAAGGTEEEGTATATQPPAPAAVQPSRDELEAQFSDGAELFATQMTLAHRIHAAEQVHAASDLLIAKIDDAVTGTLVNYVNAEGEVVEGTREEAVRARYEARPKHSFTQRAIVAVKNGDVEAKVLAEEPKEGVDPESVPTSDARREKLLSLSDQGQNVLKRKAQGSN